MKIFLEIKKIILKINPTDCALDSLTVSKVRCQFQQFPPAGPVLGRMRVLIKWWL